MSDGVLYKSGNNWSKSVANKANGASWSNGSIKHSNGASWFKNYPMEQYYTQEFGCTWTQGYNGSGVRLDPATWGDDLFAGDTINFRSLIGFDKTAIQNFIGNGQVTELILIINLKATSTNGSPDVLFGKHSFGSYPSSYNGSTNSDWGDQTWWQFPNKAYGGYWVTLQPTQATLADRVTAISGITMRAVNATAEDYGRFNGKSSYNTRLRMTVLK